MEKYKIVLVDDHTLFRNGLKMLLNAGERTEAVSYTHLDVYKRQPLGHLVFDLMSPPPRS